MYPVYIADRKLISDNFETELREIFGKAFDEVATAFIKGKSLSATRLVGGMPSLQFKDNGTMIDHNGGSDSGKWRIEDGKLCMRWQRWEYEGCGQLVRVEGKVQHLYPNASAVHLVFNN